MTSRDGMTARYAKRARLSRNIMDAPKLGKDSAGDVCAGAVEDAD
jgi:hypothetical protein